MTGILLSRVEGPDAVPTSRPLEPIQTPSTDGPPAPPVRVPTETTPRVSDEKLQLFTQIATAWKGLPPSLPVLFPIPPPPHHLR